MKESKPLPTTLSTFRLTFGKPFVREVTENEPNVGFIWEGKTMADQTAEEVLLDVRVAEASWLYKFYLNQEKKILGATAVTVFLLAWETIGNWAGLINPMFMSAPSMVWKAAVGLFVS